MPPIFTHIKFGLDLTQNPAILVACRVHKKNEPEIVLVEELDVPEDLFDESQTTDWQLIAKQVRHIAKRQKMLRYSAAVALPADKFYAEQLTLERTDIDLLTWQIEEHLETALNNEIDNIRYDFHEIAANPDKALSYRASMSAIRAALVDQLYTAFKQEKIELTAIEVDSPVLIEGALSLTRLRAKHCDALLYASEKMIRLLRFDEEMVVSDQHANVMGADWLAGASFVLEQLWQTSKTPPNPQPDHPKKAVLLCGPMASLKGATDMARDVSHFTPHSMYAHKPVHMDPGLWGRCCIAYGLTRGAGW